MLTMDPSPRSTIDGSTARQVWNAAVRSVAMISSHSAGSISRNGPTCVRPAFGSDEAVDAPEALDDGGDQRLGSGAVGQVGREALGLAAVGSDLLHDELRGLGAVNGRRPSRRPLPP